MAWTNSKIFRPFLADVLDNTTAVDLGTDIPKVALYDATITPSADVTSLVSSYTGAGSIWTAAGGGTGGPQVFQAGQWAVGGVVLTSPVLNSATSLTVFYDAADTASGSAATLSNVNGAFVYDDTLTTPVADQGICFNWFGGANQVTSGTLTVVWNANGIFRITL